MGELTELYIPVSNFRVHPFVGITHELPQFKPQLTEVKEILEVPLQDLLNKENIKATDIKINNHITLREVPYYSIQEKVIWGATAMILSEFLTVVKNSGLNAAEAVG